MNVGELCTRDVVVCARDDTVLEAARLMRQHHVGCVVVVEGEAGRRVPVGIVTDRDIVVGLVSRGLDVGTWAVGDVMGANVVTVQQTASDTDAIALLRVHGLRRLPVVDQAGVLVGIITADDCIESLAESLTFLARVSGLERRVEEQIRST
ncbi:MAG: CBS domain-containing protein [Betaproteobacteria bacterium]